MPLGGPPLIKTFSATCTDKAGNTATKTVTYTVEDQNPPVVSITSPLDGARFTIDKAVNADLELLGPGRSAGHRHQGV